MSATDDIRAVTLALIAVRAAGATVCPSEVARAVAGPADWRGAMPAVHAAIDRMAADGLVRLSWKGVRLPVRDGPYRDRLCPRICLKRAEARFAVPAGTALKLALSRVFKQPPTRDAQPLTEAMASIFMITTCNSV